ncbi:MAG: hypothetical protein HKN13_13445 [Rhodothermales bacterium]|nr:hypothetical protein [Rhodothermales bacterium]
MNEVISIRPAVTKGEIRRFIDFPYQLYRDEEYYVAPLRMDISKALNPKKNAFFEHGQIQPFLALDASGKTLGRIAGIENGMHLKKYNDGNGFFGFFECIEDYSVANALLDAAAKWLQDRGLTGVRGPTNPSMNDICGLLVDGFDRRPSIMMPYNLSYYKDFLERYGFTRAMTMWAYYVHKKYVDVSKLDRGVAIVKRRNPSLSIRTLDMTRFEEEAQTILDIYNEAWSRNWGHVPMTQAEFSQLTHEMKQVVDPRIVYIVEDNGTPVAFSISLPDMNIALKEVPDGKLFPTGLPKLLARAKFGGISEVRTLLMGVRLAWQGKGLDALMNHAIIHEGPRFGYSGCEMSWVLDANSKLINTLVNINSVKDKEYAMYEMRFSD